MFPFHVSRSLIDSGGLLDSLQYLLSTLVWNDAKYD
jgi:hypothetical protein